MRRWFVAKYEDMSVAELDALNVELKGKQNAIKEERLALMAVRNRKAQQEARLRLLKAAGLDGVDLSPDAAMLEAKGN